MVTNHYLTGTVSLSPCRGQLFLSDPFESAQFKLLYRGDRFVTLPVMKPGHYYDHFSLLLGSVHIALATFHPQGQRLLSTPKAGVSEQDKSVMNQSRSC